MHCRTCPAFCKRHSAFLELPRGFAASVWRLHAHQSGCVDVRWGRPSCGRRSCTCDTWRVSPLSAAWCDAAGCPSGWKRPRTGCTGTDALLRTRTQQTHFTVKRQKHTEKSILYVLLAPNCVLMYPTGQFMIAPLSLTSLWLIPPLTTISLLYVGEKACCCCRNTGSLHYKHPGRRTSGTMERLRGDPAACRVTLSLSLSLRAPPAPPTPGALIEQEPFRLSLPVP